jgi:flagellar basal-body rod modification protein FlgD
MATTNGVSGTTNDLAVGQNQNVPRNSIDSDAFMQLLVAQLRYQDPMSGMDQGAFMQQLATMTSMQQQQSINSQLASLVQQSQLTQATGLVGRNISGLIGEEKISGKVDSVVVTTDGIALKVGGDYLSMSQITEVL